MGKIKICAFLLVSALLVGMLASCGSEKVTAEVTVRIVAGDDVIVNDRVITIEGTTENPPTVLQAIRETLIELDLPYDDNDASITKITDYSEYDDEERYYFWDYTVNNVAPTSGKAGSNTVKDGDVISFKYDTMEKVAG